MGHLQSFNQSSFVIQSFKAYCSSVHDTRDSYNDSDDSFFVCEIQEKAAKGSPRRSLYADLHVSANVCSKHFVLVIQILHTS